MDIAKRIAKAKTSLILEHPFIGTIALNMPTEITEAVPTAATNGRVIKYNPKFIEELSDEQVKFLVAHECMHPMLEHNYRRNGRTPLRWNKAADYVINKLLVDEGIGKFIDGGCLDDNIYKAGNGTSDGIYNILPEEGGDGQGGGGVGGTGQDLEDGEGSPAEVEQQAAEWKVKVAQAAQAAKMMGKMSANMERLVGEILQPKVDWREVLRRFVQKARTDVRSWSRPNRRFLAQGMYLPSVSGETMGELVVAVDCSGSIDDRTLSEFATELRAIKEDCLPVRIHVIYFSHEVTHYESYSQDDDLNIKGHGGGGTAFSPVFGYMRDNAIEPVATIFLTDLYCDDFGTPPDCPVLWVSNGRSDAPFGEVVMM